MNEIIYSSRNIKSTKKADHILEMPGMRIICDHYLQNFTLKISLTNEYKNYIKIQRHV